LNLIEKTSGRVIVTGMGKSGHIARKIAATLASTGQPAFFVHPAEASHGDLGMITPQDVVLALSNSGETPELSNLIQYASRFSIPLIAITSGKDSLLAQAASVILLLPNMREACPMGLAPTTSTTAMMALGDTLAITLLRQRGFSDQDFQTLHPGGKLGRKLLRVSDLMHKGEDMPVTREETIMSQVILIMTEKRLGCVGVLDNHGKLVGIITDGDLRRHMSPSLLSQTAKDIMTLDPKTISSKALAVEALAIMNESKITNLFVVDEVNPCGIVHVHDFLHTGVV
jgi:arabinose-5-phosphate isomerase